VEACARGAGTSEGGVGLLEKVGVGWQGHAIKKETMLLTLGLNANAARAMLGESRNHARNNGDHNAYI
jgi:hypothetical protein